ncbi:hypothetical protein [Clavibacter tessellarius]|uniref:hypothetical protein n=1 Tax=Clavibacter tessellarius TaxID=31965 RepID=UPI003248730D
MISRLLVVLCVVLTVVVAGSAAVDADMRDRAARDAVAAGWGSPFVVPVLPETTDPGIVADAFATAAQETGVSVVRRAKGVDGGQERTTLYVLLTDGSQLPGAFPLSTGRFLTPEESGAAPAPSPRRRSATPRPSAPSRTSARTTGSSSGPCAPRSTPCCPTARTAWSAGPRRTAAHSWSESPRSSTSALPRRTSRPTSWRRRTAAEDRARAGSSR